ncbi:KpsF/GutQ family sugar-phosphate isomerase [Pseudorhodoplanes sp.]|uniref:KpsF/GutQ family sugar-phosphate isomerase n=1 Tax=Pseudorhodoplanes sp. TaxID=1934341 RepID=UPI002BA96207|nr:KpsF/GutQ family sugar-phosphate isomerase [Pseudorhodoplanes sp.]HWV54450.1 KpsF/GutQ family sugar-phosphate isomerase [Pseudorhodoplanes sp.]
MAEATVKAKSGASDRDASIIRSGLQTLDAAGSGIAALSGALRDGLGRAFTAAVEIIDARRKDETKGRLIVTGMGKSGHVARKLAATFASTGTPAFFVHPSEASHGDLGMIQDEDVILALSWSGETAELKNIIDYAKRRNIALIGMTSDANSTLGRASDVVLTLPQVREACPHNLAPTTSSLMQLALGDALAITLLETRGFSPTDFHVLHPGGRLGALLKLARDVMRTGTQMPTVILGARMSDAVVEMSAKGLGCVGIVDAHGSLCGIITDGDLRRHMGPGLTESAVEDVMTRNPKTCRPDQLVSEVIEVLNSSKITAMFVVEEHRPVGILHLHDLLRMGAA